MVASTGIKYFVHTNTNAPQLDNVQGSMIAVLDACLVNGLTLGTVNSMTATGTTVTVNFGSAHNLLRFQVLKIAGAIQAEYNGEHRILSVPTTSSITFEVSTAPSASPATGTITARLPPLGWSLPFTGTGKRAYKNTDAESPYLRVIDAVDPSYNETYAKYAKVGMVETMTGIDAMSGHQAPYDALLPDKNWIGVGSGTTGYNGWAKWAYAGSAGAEASSGISKTTAAVNGARTWLVVGDGETFYIINKVNAISATETPVVNGFGKLFNLSKVGASPYFMSATDDYSQNSSAYRTQSTLTTTRNNDGQTAFMFKNYKNESLLSRASSSVFASASLSVATGYDILYLAADAYIDVFSTEYILAENGNIPRGKVPLLRWLSQKMPYSNYQAIMQDGKMLLAVNVAAYTQQGQLLIDLGQA